VSRSASFRIIGICGAPRAGKDAVASILATLHGYTRIALADGVRAALSDLDGPTHVLSKQDGYSDRRACQVMGGEARYGAAELAGLDEDVLWTQLALTKIHFSAWYARPARTLIVVPDVRHPWEITYLRRYVARMGGDWQLWRVERPGLEEIPEAGHESETYWPTFDVDGAILNDGSLEDLAVKVAGLEAV
jgi:hypothetical protein